MLKSVRIVRQIPRTSIYSRQPQRPNSAFGPPHRLPVHHDSPDPTTLLHFSSQFFQEAIASVIHSYRRRLAVCALSSVCGRPGQHVTLSDSSVPAISFTSVAPSQCSCSSRTVLRFVVGPSSIEDSRFSPCRHLIVFLSSLLDSRAKAALPRSTKPGRVGFARCLCSVRARVC